jgi:curved DNA-binding protein CbpA
MPCTEEQVLAAYRRKVKEMHPDKGGSLQKFLQLQRHFEQAMYLARSHAKVRTVSVE